MKSKALTKVLKEPSVVFYDDLNPHPEYGKHVYVTKNGELYTGNSTISGAWRKDFLAPWHAKEAINLVITKIPEIATICQEHPEPQKDIKLIELLTDCKFAAKRIADKAKEDGTIAHAWVEAAINSKIDQKSEPLETPDNGEAKNAINAFSKWAKQSKPEWLATEEVVCSDEHRVAGKIDCIANINGISTLLDFKTSKQISEDALIQLAGYSLMLKEMGFEPRQWMVVRLPKDGKDVETLTVADLSLMEFYQKTFLHLREAYKFFIFAENKLKENRKIVVDTK